VPLPWHWRNTGSSTFILVATAVRICARNGLRKLALRDGIFASEASIGVEAPGDGLLWGRRILRRVLRVRRAPSSVEDEIQEVRPQAQGTDVIIIT
jgi:hypothetical protein